MKTLVQNHIENYESSTHQRSSNAYMSRKSISPNSSEDFDLKCENVILSQQIVRSSQSILDERQINNILNRDINNNSNQNQNSIDYADIDSNKQTDNQKSNRSSNSNLQEDVLRNPAYQTLLSKHQKLEQDFNELTYKYNNIEHQNQIIAQENEHLKQQQLSQKDMNNAQKETIKQLQLRITSLQKDVKTLEDERDNFKKDCERKYQINQLLTLQQITKNEQPNNNSQNTRADASVNQSPQISTNSVRFSEKDFMRGQTVQKNQKLLSFLNNDDTEVNSHSYKLGCLRQSVNIYENEFIKVQVSKIDQSELSHIPSQMGLNVSVLNKSNINIKNFEIQYQSNTSVKIMAEGNNNSSQSLNSQNVFQQKIYIETNTLPFQIPEMIIKFQYNYLKKTITIPLPITINSMLDYETIQPQQLNDVIGMWNNSPADQIQKSAVFTVSKQLVDKKTSLHQFFPTFSHVQSSSVNFYELVGLVKIPLANKATAAVKITLVNDRFICFQIKSINTNTKSLNGIDNQSSLKNNTNTLQFIIQTFQELFSDN